MYPEGTDIGQGWRIVRHRPESRHGDMHVNVERISDPKGYANYSGAQIDATSVNKSPASEAATVQWTLTYPQ